MTVYGPLLGCRPSRQCSSSARATEQRLAGRRAASGARLKPNVRPLVIAMNLRATHRSVAHATLFELPGPLAGNCPLGLHDADSPAVARKLQHWLSPVACYKFSPAHHWLAGWRFDQTCQWVPFRGSESLVVGALVERRWPNTAFNRTRRQRSFLHRTLTRARRLTQR